MYKRYLCECGRDQGSPHIKKCGVCGSDKITIKTDSYDVYSNVRTQKIVEKEVAERNGESLHTKDRK